MGRPATPGYTLEAEAPAAGPSWGGKQLSGGLDLGPYTHPSRALDQAFPSPPLAPFLPPNCLRLSVPCPPTPAVCRDHQPGEV